MLRRRCLAYLVSPRLRSGHFYALWLVRTALGGLCFRLLLGLGRHVFMPRPRWAASALHTALLTLLAVFVVFLTPVGLGIFSAASSGAACEQRLLLSLQTATAELPAAVATTGPARAGMC